MLNEKQTLAIDLFNIDEKNVQDIQYHNDSGDAIIEITLNRTPIACPECGCYDSKIKEYITKRINHSVLTSRRCTLLYHARRYKCPICSKTFYENNPFTFKSQKISVLTVMNILDDLKKPQETYASVAERYHVSPTTVADIFDAHVEIPRNPLPEMITIDEVHAFDSGDSPYVCIMMDFETGRPVDILPSRKLIDLESYFNLIPLEERRNVKYVCSDMYDGYRSVFRNCFPQSQITYCLDKYHIIADLSRRADKTRIRIMNMYKNDKRSDEYYLLKTFRYILWKPVDAKTKNGRDLFDPYYVPKKMNGHFHQYLNFYQLRNKALDIHPDLRCMWDIKDDFRELFNITDPMKAEKELDRIINKIKDNEPGPKKKGIKELRGFSRVLTNWRTEILNAIHVMTFNYQVDNRDGSVASKFIRMTSSVSENRNRIVQLAKGNASGFRNWNRFRNRMMYVLDKNAKYSVYPIEKKIQEKKRRRKELEKIKR